ncbi:HET-domain-containing protein [Teratosphaeria nubilosa]|uniref:HET-domain-containing protein n=1 Tax=Teratosphaeria nubilosa TaxID=161662 RepID=A0A6G1KSU9_9PEZI|nr:HET-domain-containing protein [Teratosphaeria nubilosa]
MWLLNVLTYKLKFFNSLSDVQYTILSHTWGEEEVLYRDLEHLETAQTKLGWTKIRYICQQTIEDGLLWTWIDTCCIDKHSSTELSEAINSMFSWYQSAAVCHAYFAETWDSLCVDDAVKWRRFEESRWWTRGWTLQELLAPQKVCFWDCHWAPYGQLQDLAARVSRITSIELDVLLKIKALDDVCVARKFSWASSRETTRVEDEAYALLGILGVSLPIIYGEGSKAFRRLQEEFIKSSTDLSIFAWSRQVSTSRWRTPE